MTPCSEYCQITANKDVLTSTRQCSEDEKQQFIEQAKEQSDFTADVEVSAEDCLLVLSTCSYEYSDARYVLIGKLTELSCKCCILPFDKCYQNKMV